MAIRNNVVLIGMPSAGKSTLGVVLAKRLNLSFVDADLLIQRHADKTLQTIIDSAGPEGFLEVENAVLSQINCERTVIATGGSAVYSHDAMEHLSSIGIVVYLHITLDEMRKRVGDLDERGVVLRDGHDMSLKALYSERLPLYQQYAEITLDVTHISVREAAIELSKELAKKYPVEFARN